MLGKNLNPLLHFTVESAKELTLKNCGLDDGDVGMIMYALKKCPRNQLTVLDLSGNRIGDVGAKQISSAFNHKNMYRLTSLSLNNTMIGDEGMVTLAKAVATNDKVEISCRGGNKLSVAGVKEVITILGGREFCVSVAIQNAEENKEVYDATVAGKIDRSSVVTYLPDSQFYTVEWFGISECLLLSEKITLSTRDKLDKKIDFLSNKYDTDEKIKKFISALRALSYSIKQDVEVQLSRGHVLTPDEAKKISQSSAMVILRATDEMLETVLKGDMDLNKTLDSLNGYVGDCQKAAEWTLWQTMVMGVIAGVAGFLSVIVPSLGAALLAISDTAEDDPQHAIHLLARMLSLPAAVTTFFTPYNKLVSNVVGAGKSISNSETPEGDCPQPK